MTTEIGSFLDWFEARCVRAEKFGFVELKEKQCHARARGRRGEKKNPKSDFVEVSKRNSRNCWRGLPKKKEAA